jgi:hypothetical protein
MSYSTWISKSWICSRKAIKQKCPCYAVMRDNIHQVDANMRRSSRNNVLCSTLYKSKGSLVAITKVLLYFKLCSLWLPQMLTSGIRYSGWSLPFAIPWQIKTRRNISDPNPNGNRWNRATRHTHGRRNPSVRRQQEISGYSLLRWKRYSCEFPVYGENSEPWLLYWNSYTKK